MWRELVESLEPNSTFSPPATEQQLKATEETLRIVLPEDLRSLLSETNGVEARYTYLIWNVNQLVDNNVSIRTGYKQTFMPFDSLLFFSEAGNGDFFAFPIIGQVVRNRHIYAWDHETDGRAYVAFSLKDFIERWLNGKIRL